MNDHTTHDSSDEIPYGYCHCGCGQKTTIATRSDARRGAVKGEPRRFISHHHQKPSIAPPNPSGLCMCGCGQLTPIATESDASQHRVKGEHIRFIKGHFDKARTSLPIEVRFWRKVQVGAPDECWEWKTKTTNGYGVLNDKGRLIGAHRISYELHNGPIPEGMCVCHHCDNPPCVNPAHLFLGTDATNARDMVQKGRQSHEGRLKGEAHHAAKLSASDVIQLRAMAAQGISRRKIAGIFGITVDHTNAIIRRRCWKHIP